MLFKLYGHGADRLGQCWPFLASTLTPLFTCPVISLLLESSSNTGLGDRDDWRKVTGRLLNGSMLVRELLAHCISGRAALVEAVFD